MPNDQAAMIAEAKKILAEKGIELRRVGYAADSNRNSFELFPLRRDFGAEAVDEFLRDRPGFEQMKRITIDGSTSQYDMAARIANSAADAALNEAAKIIVSEFTQHDLKVSMSTQYVLDKIAALKSTPSVEATT